MLSSLISTLLSAGIAGAPEEKKSKGSKVIDDKKKKKKEKKAFEEPEVAKNEEAKEIVENSNEIIEADSSDIPDDWETIGVEQPVKDAKKRDAKRPMPDLNKLPAGSECVAGYCDMVTDECEAV